MPAEAYTVRLVSAPGKSMDREAITRAELAGFLEAVAKGLAVTGTPLERLTVEVTRLDRVDAEPDAATNGGTAALARALYDDLAGEMGVDDDGR